MPVAKCVRRCFDHRIGVGHPRRYWPGDQDDLPVDHVFIKTGCFQFLNPIEGQEGKEPTSQPLPELKRGRGNPNWSKRT